MTRRQSRHSLHLQHPIRRLVLAGIVLTTVAVTIFVTVPPPKAQPPKRAATVSASSPCAQNSQGKLLLVSIAKQHMWACDGSRVVRQSSVTTGKTLVVNGVDDATPTGTWHIYDRQTNTTLKGCDANGCWNDPVAYWMPFDDQVGFHDASRQTFHFGSSEYKTGGSHGCVHLPTQFMAWVYGWAPVGTTVTVES